MTTVVLALLAFIAVLNLAAFGWIGYHFWQQLRHTPRPIEDQPGWVRYAAQLTRGGPIPLRADAKRTPTANR